QSARPLAARLGEPLEGLKLRVQDRIFERWHPKKLEDNPNLLLAKINEAIHEIIQEEGLLLTADDQARLVEMTTNEMVGLGPLEPLLQDNDVSDILVNGFAETYTERRGKLYKTNIRFHDDEHLMSVINRIVARVGRRIDESSPMVDARLPDGSRVNAIIPPLSIDGPSLSIRRFGGHTIQIYDLIRNQSLTSEMAEFLRLAVLARLNIVVAGGTGSGKT